MPGFKHAREWQVAPGSDMLASGRLRPGSEMLVSNKLRSDLDLLVSGEPGPQKRLCFVGIAEA